MNRIITPPRLQLPTPAPEVAAITASQRQFVEESCKMLAKIMLSDAGRRSIVIPERIEWVGVNLLERDDGLPARKETAR